MPSSLPLEAITLILLILSFTVILLSYFILRLYSHVDKLHRFLATQDTYLHSLSSHADEVATAYLQSYFTNLLRHIPNSLNLLSHQHAFFLALADSDIPAMKSITEVVYKEVRQKYETKPGEPPINFILGN